MRNKIHSEKLVERGVQRAGHPGDTYGFLQRRR
jgi:hypothetical protein